MSEDLDTTRAYAWPSPPLNVVLVRPEIPPNTGTIARLCAASGAHLHLVGPLGFRLHDRDLRRAGLDYWDAVEVTRYADWDAFLPQLEGNRFFLFSTRSRTLYTSVAYAPGDWLLFGSETTGLPESLLARHPERALTLPMRREAVRSLNLASTVSVVVYEALRQIGARENA